ncbi:MAG: hypothetical protein Q9181_002762 [Wetmoreana brouardii]
MTRIIYKAMILSNSTVAAIFHKVLKPFTLAMNQTSAYKNQLAHWNDDTSPEHVAAGVVLIIATLLILGVRFFAQCRISKQFEADNVLILFAFSNGAGKHLARVMATDTHKPRQMIRILKSAYAIALLHGPCLGLIKISILLFYRRIFTMHRRTFQVAFYILGTYTLVLTVVTIFVFMFQCLPITFFWERAYRLENVEPPHPIKGHCLPPPWHLAPPILILNTISDIALLTLPAVGLWKLQLPRAKKIGLFVVFSLGAFVVSVGVVRIYYTFKAGTQFMDIPWDNANIMLWTAIECCVGNICASLPAMAPLLKRPKANTPSSSRLFSTLQSFTPKFIWRWSSSPQPLRNSRSSDEDADGTSLRVLNASVKGPTDYVRQW